MKKFICVMCFVVIMSSFCYAGEPFRFGAGKLGNTYDMIGRKFFPAQLNGKIQIDVVNTAGTKEIITMIKNGELDGGMVQMDYFIIDNMAPVEVVAKTHDEYVHLVGMSLDELLKTKKKLAIGKVDGGTSITWNAFCKEDPSYKDIPVEPQDGALAMGRVQSGEYGAMLYVGGLRSKDMMRANNSNMLLQKVDDWDFNDTEFRGKKIYEFTDIDDDVYPNMIPGLFQGSVKTVKVPAVFVVSTKWIEDHGNEYEILYDAVQRAIPNIKAALVNN